MANQIKKEGNLLKRLPSSLHASFGLERNLPDNLHQSSGYTCGLESSVDAGRLRRGGEELSKVPRRQVVLRESEVRMVQNVIEIRSQTEPYSLTYIEILRERSVRIKVAWSPEKVSVGRSESGFRTRGYEH